MRPLRILHVAPYWAEAWAYGGIPRVVGAFASHLASAGHAVTVCATDACTVSARLSPRDPADRPGNALRPWAPFRTAEDAEVRIFPNRSNRLAYRWQAFTPIGLYGYLRDHAGSFDVAHLHACRNLPGAIASRHLIRHGVPYVLAPNGTAPIIERRRLAKRAFDGCGGHRVLDQASAVLAVSEAERRQLLAIGVPGGRIHCVPNPLDVSDFVVPVERGRFRRRLGLGDRPLVLFLGKITPRKRLDVLTRAFASLQGRCPGAHLVIAGSDMGGLHASLALARELGVDGRVSVAGLLVGRDRIEAFADADLVVYPSEHEVFGLVALEALLAGTPVVVAGDSGCGEVVNGTGGGLIVPPGDVAVLAAAIASVLRAPSAWRAEAASASDRVSRAYDAAAVTDRLLGVYTGLLSPRRATASRPRGAGVSVIVPVKNGLATLERTLASIEAQAADGLAFEILVVDDASSDGSSEWLRARAEAGRIRLLRGAGRGPSAAMNLGLKAARFPVICQVDQDVELLPGWMTRLMAVLDLDDRCGAVQGHYTSDRNAPAIARAMALDLEQRYLSLSGGMTDHVCTGNTAYRAQALLEAGLFDESLGYGNDNDMSYRLRAAGWRLAHCAEARSLHRWRDRFWSYCRQQYGFGYGRLDVVRRHPCRLRGDRVSPPVMMAHPAGMLGALVLIGAAIGLSVSGVSGGAVAGAAGAGLLVLLGSERAIAGIGAFRRFRDPAALLFPVLHLARDLSWVAAMVVWSMRQLARRAARPSHSMRSRPADRLRAPASIRPSAAPEPPRRVLGVVPAHNEAATLGAVIADLRRVDPRLDVLVVDDGSTDRTAEVLADLDVRWLRMPERMGIGRAMRAGLRYAERLGYDAVVRLDGDGQHRAEHLDRLLAPIRDGRADMVLGSRFLQRAGGRPTFRAAARSLLRCYLSAVTRHPVTDPTSGYCALGPRALRLLADHHPTGYPEPELRLFLSRNGLSVLEVPVEARGRLGGRTSLTPGRLATAAARILLALLIVPLRSAVGATESD
jgi:glycosyltransferase involved in cell wall biosynthesis